jgi:hypothetical protein
MIRQCWGVQGIVSAYVQPQSVHRKSKQKKRQWFGERKKIKKLENQIPHLSLSVRKSNSQSLECCRKKKMNAAETCGLSRASLMLRQSPTGSVPKFSEQIATSVSSYP